MKGFQAVGIISKIEYDPRGFVTQTVRNPAGIDSKLTPFKPNKLFKNKVGDPYCQDMTSDND